MAEVRGALLQYTKAHNIHVELGRPKVLAMMRLIDDDRTASISFAEFRAFCCKCIEDKRRNEAALDISKLVSSQALVKAHYQQIHEKSTAELRELEFSIKELLHSVKYLADTREAGPIQCKEDSDVVVRVKKDHRWCKRLCDSWDSCLKRNALVPLLCTVTAVWIGTMAGVVILRQQRA